MGFCKRCLLLPFNWMPNFVNKKIKAGNRKCSSDAFVFVCGDFGLVFAVGDTDVNGPKL